MPDSPLSEPTLRELEIPGVQFANSRVVEYNSSVLVEPYRAGWGGLYKDPIEHLYWIITQRGVVRKWGRHKYTTDRYSAVYGSVEVALVDGRDDSETAGKLIVVPLAGERGEGLYIPPGVWHTFRATTDTAVLMNSKNPSYNAEVPDKELRPMPNDEFDFTWSD